MPDMTLKHWEKLSSAAREAFARGLAARLPHGFAFDALRTHALADSRHEVAEFLLGEARFVLVPGGEVELGFAVNQGWRPTEEELASWADTAEEHGIEATLEEHLAQALLPPRRATLPTLLVEKTASEAGWKRLALDAPLSREALAEFGSRPAAALTIHGGGSTTHVTGSKVTRVTRTPTGPIVERSMGLTHEDLVERLTAKGFRLPTSDEWEHACAAGARTLFRWGDHAPCDRYPSDRHGEGPHQAPNAFGLHIARNTYAQELTADPATTRGGDGGSMECGGTGFFVGWLPLATAYFEEHACTREHPDGPINVGYEVARRVVEIS